MSYETILENINWSLDDENLDNAFLIRNRYLSREQQIINLNNKLRESLILIPNQRTGLINIKVLIGRTNNEKYFMLSYTPEQIRTVGDFFGALVSFFNNINPETGRRYIDDPEIQKKFFYLRYKGSGGNYEAKFYGVN